MRTTTRSAVFQRSLPSAALLLWSALFCSHDRPPQNSGHPLRFNSRLGFAPLSAAALIRSAPAASKLRANRSRTAPRSSRRRSRPSAGSTWLSTTPVRPAQLHSSTSLMLSLRTVVLVVRQLPPRLVHSWDTKRIYSYSHVFPIGGEWGAYSPAVFGRFGRFWYSAVSGFRPFLGGM